MNWVSANWIWILIAVAFLGMHMFGHGGHGGHSGHGGGHGGHGGDDASASLQPPDGRAEERPAVHRH